MNDLDFGATWCEPLRKGRFVEAALDPVDPSDAEGLVECFFVGERRRIRDALLGQS